MKDVFQGVLLFVALTFVAMRSEADDLSGRLASLFTNQQAEYIDYESVSSSHAQEYGDLRYLVMDFAYQSATEDQRQGAVHAICSKLLKDIGLVTELSHRGFNMVSVSFDRESQYDCL